MVYFIRKLYLIKKTHVILILLAFLLIYYLIYYNNENPQDLDFTRQNIFEAENKPLLDNEIHKSSNRGRPSKNQQQQQKSLPDTTPNCLEKSLKKLAHDSHKNNAQVRLSSTRYIVVPQDLSNREDISQYIEKSLQEALKEEKGAGCEIPKLNPFAPEIMKFNKDYGPIVCDERDWVRCYHSECRLDESIKVSAGDDIECTYRDILYKTDFEYSLGIPTVLVGANQVYELELSDHVKVSCKMTAKKNSIFGSAKHWKGHVTAFRPIKPAAPPPGREKTPNVLIFGFDSTSKNGFIRKMPKSYELLRTELGAIVLNGFNVVGDGTPATLFPLLTGKTELELPESRRSIKNSGHLDNMPFVFYKLKDDGYRTAYFEDCPWIGTFQYRFNGFLHQPADHYLRSFYMEESNGGKKWGKSSKKYCVGDTPRFQLMMNITDQFLSLDGKKYIFTFVADITHDDFNWISSADEPFVDFLQQLKDRGQFEDTLLMVMGDHGPRYSDVRSTLQGKLEERLPLMAIRLPDALISKRPDALKALQSNVDALTTPHDMYATIMDVIDMREHWNNYTIKGADLPRGMTLLKPIPRNRTCSEAGIETHWCACQRWYDVDRNDPIYMRVARALVDRINEFTKNQRQKCAIRTLTSVEYVMKKERNTKMLQFSGAKDQDGYVGKFGKPIPVTDVYQVKLTVGPGAGVYEASVTHNKDDTFSINTREISRSNAYNKEPECISHIYPHLNPYCYCIK